MGLILGREPVSRCPVFATLGELTQGGFLAIRYVVTIQVDPGRGDDFVGAFKALKAIAQQEEGCEQCELFQSLDDPEKVVLLERWASQDHVDKHMAAERSRNRSAVDALVALWVPGTTPTIERFEV